MAKKNSKISLPSGQGGLLGGFNESFKTNLMFSPKVVIYLSVIVVVFELVLHNLIN